MLILASLSGIQDFLFDVRESGGKQARSLRFRSFRIQLIAECLALRLLDALRQPDQPLPYDRLIFCAAGNVCLDASGADDAAMERVRRAAADVETRLLHETHGRLRLAVVLQPTPDGFASTYEQAHQSLAEQKLRSWTSLARGGADSSAGWPAGGLVIPAVFDADKEAERDARLGERLTRTPWLSMWKPDGDGDPATDEVLGVRVQYTAHPPESSPQLLSCSSLESPGEPPAAFDRSRFHVRRLARHIPRGSDRKPIEFVDIAAAARGAQMLGVLKADVDSLGAAVSNLLKQSGQDASMALRCFSDALDGFFAQQLQEEMRRAAERDGVGGRRWHLIYTVFAGGDDMLLVGPWHLMLDFAGHMHQLFDQQFGLQAQQRLCPAALTISAGVAIIKPKYPIHLAARQADELLDQAKERTAPGASQPKDQCAALGQVWKWGDHKAIVDNGKCLADWVDAGAVRRGWLHTLLQLALLRRREAGREYAGVPPEVATSRLAYHVARNWRQYDRPRDDQRQAANAARQWVDEIVEHFDSPSEQAPPKVRYLPAILRYALLASRSEEDR